MKIFYQKIKNEEEFLHCEEENKYSILEFISYEFKEDGYYEFLLEYPKISGYNDWKQKNILNRNI